MVELFIKSECLQILLDLVALKLQCAILARGDLVKAGRYTPQGEFCLAGVLDVNLRHTRLRWTAPACRAKRLDGVRRSGKNRFDMTTR
jgi:hypothetical protein